MIELRAVVIGVGNSFRRDDGVGPAVAAQIEGRDLPGVRVLTVLGEPTEILDAWDGSALAVLVDAAVTDPPAPGRIHRCEPTELRVTPPGVSSHGLGIPATLELGRALGRVPGRLVVYTVGVADTGHGSGLTPAVAAAVPHAVAAVIDELATRVSPSDTSTG